jgi:hypothetical protein
MPPGKPLCTAADCQRFLSGATKSDLVTYQSIQNFYVHFIWRADQLRVPYDPLELLHVPDLVHCGHGGHRLIGLPPEKLQALLSA